MAHPETPTELREVPVGVFLRRFREDASTAAPSDRRITLRSVAKRAGCAPSSLSRIENLTLNPSPELTGRVAHAIGALLAEKQTRP